MLKPIVVNAEECRDYLRSSRLEWLETNGAGGFAMGSVSGINMRRYHGLLVASLRAPVERYVLLSKVDEEVTVDGRPYALGASQYPGEVQPTGFQHIEEFRLDPFPVWRFPWLEKRVFLLPGLQTVVLEYRARVDCALDVRPFLAFRDYHSLTQANGDFRTDVVAEDGLWRMQPYSGLPPLWIRHTAATFGGDGSWYHNFEYLAELDRGLEFREDLYTPGAFQFDLRAGESAWIVAGIADPGPLDQGTQRAWAEEQVRRRDPAEQDPFTARLSVAADQFLVHRADGCPTIIAGYPWFTDWGRDTMIALPGLLTARGRLDEARQIIENFLQYLDQGLIPNRFPDSGQTPEYNTADGTLWMFPPVWGYLEAGGDWGFVRDVFYPAAKEIIDWHRRGTRYDIFVDDSDQLLCAGGPGTQLTWMDAKVGNWVVTPRHGKPVDINALWYNALRMTESWAAKIGESVYGDMLNETARRMQASFRSKFWNPARECLYDVLAPAGPDAKLRPNQIFAVSLPFPLLDEEQSRSVVRAVESTLLTPVGLRTLEPADPDYRSRYQGNSWERDGAYHQGTVWPWLLGPFVSAYLRAFGRSDENLCYCRTLVRRMEPELERAGLGSLSEIHDGDPPHRAAGTISQAWSVSELLRVLKQDLV